MIRIANIVLPSQHYTEAVRFYRDVLSLPVAFENEDCCFVRVGGVRIALHPASGDDAFAPTGHGFYLDLLTADLNALKARLTESGVALLREWNDPAGQPFLLVADPDGNRLEFYEPPQEGEATA